MTGRAAGEAEERDGGDLADGAAAVRLVAYCRAVPNVALRIEVSGGFSGGAYRYESLLLGSVAKFRDEVVAFFSDGFVASSMVSWEFSCVVEELQDAALVRRQDLRPALTLHGGGHIWTFSEDGRFVLDGETLDFEGWQSNINVAVSCFEAGARALVNWDRLQLTLPRGEPLEDGVTWTVVSSAGVTHDQVAGEWIGDFDEAHAFMP